MDRVIRSLAGASLLLLGSHIHAQTATDVVCTGCVGSSDLAGSAVSSPKILDGGVKAPDLASGAVTSRKIAANAVTATKIRDASVGMADLAPAVQDLLAGAIASLTTARVQQTGTGVASAVCPANRLAVGATCDCSNAGGSRNFGVLFACQITATGAAAGCYNEAYSYDPQLPEPLARVVAVCLGATSTDGTPWVPSSAPPSSEVAGPEAGITGSDSDADSVALSDTSAKQQAEHDAAVSALQDQVASHTRNLWRRQQ